MLFPVLPPTTLFSVQGTIELDDDVYSGMKIRLDASLFFRVETFGLSPGFGINYEIHEGTLFGFETVPRIGLALKI